MYSTHSAGVRGNLTYILHPAQNPLIQYSHHCPRLQRHRLVPPNGLELLTTADGRIWIILWICNQHIIEPTLHHQNMTILTKYIMCISTLNIKEFNLSKTQSRELGSFMLWLILTINWIVPSKQWLHGHLGPMFLPKREWVWFVGGLWAIGI